METEKNEDADHLSPYQNILDRLKTLESCNATDKNDTVAKTNVMEIEKK